jgi:hypothetical protein
MLRGTSGAFGSQRLNTLRLNAGNFMGLANGEAKNPSAVVSRWRIDNEPELEAADTAPRLPW